MKADKILAQRISGLRKTTGFSVRYIARKLHVTTSTYIQYERARREVPLHKIRDFANLYLVTADYLIGLTDEPLPHGLIDRLWEDLRARAEALDFFGEAFWEEVHAARKKEEPSTV